MALKERNRCLDFLKGMACIGVVFMHCMFPYPYGQVISFVFKFSVPIFFLISGYYSYYPDTHYVGQKLIGKVKHIACLLVLSEGLYFLMTIIIIAASDQPISIAGMFSKQMLLAAVVLNKPMFNGTLWFLYALLFSYLILFLVNHFHAYKVAYCSIVVVLLAHIVIRTILKRMNVEWYDVAYFRNAIMYGFPMLIAGNLIRKQEANCCKVSTKMCLMGIGGGILLTFIEHFATGQVLDFYVGTLITSYFLFIFALLHKKDPIIPLIEKIGCKLSLGIYVVHILCIELTSRMLIYLGLDHGRIIQWMRPVICVVMAIVIVAIYVFMKERIHSYVSLKTASKVA